MACRPIMSDTAHCTMALVCKCFRYAVFEWDDARSDVNEEKILLRSITQNLAMTKQYILFTNYPTYSQLQNSAFCRYCFEARIVRHSECSPGRSGGVPDRISTMDCRQIWVTVLPVCLPSGCGRRPHLDVPRAEEFFFLSRGEVRRTRTGTESPCRLRD